MKVLCVAEKPSISKAVAGHLAGRSPDVVSIEEILSASVFVRLILLPAQHTLAIHQELWLRLRLWGAMGIMQRHHDGRPRPSHGARVHGREQELVTSSSRELVFGARGHRGVAGLLLRDTRQEQVAVADLRRTRKLWPRISNAKPGTANSSSSGQIVIEKESILERRSSTLPRKAMPGSASSVPRLATSSERKTALIFVTKLL